MFIIIVFWLGCDELFSCFFLRFLLFSLNGSVTGCDHTWEFLLFLSLFSYCFHASSFWLLLLRLCNNRCAEALVVKQKFSFEYVGCCLNLFKQLIQQYCINVCLHWLSLKIFLCVFIFLVIKYIFMKDLFDILLSIVCQKSVLLT